MPKAMTRAVLLAAVLCAAGLTLAADPPVSAKAGSTPAAAGPAPRLANGKPDLSGHWNNPYTPDMALKGTVVDPKTRQPLEFSRAALPDAKASAAGSAARTLDLPYTDWGLKRWKTYDPVNDGDYAGSCLPFGMSRNINSPHGVQVVHTPDALALLFEQNTWFHWVPTGGQKWPADMPPSWNGVSTGRWDGDTLVVNSLGFKDQAWIDEWGTPGSDQLKLTERIRRPTFGALEVQMTVEDPKTFTKPFTFSVQQRLMPDTELIEFVCGENNTPAKRLVGH